MHFVGIKQYEAPPVCLSEILRYAGVRGEAPEIEARIKDMLPELLPLFSYSVCYSVQEIKREGEVLDLGLTRLCSDTASRALAGCEAVLFLVATVGHGIDRFVARSAVTSPAAAQLANAIGTERVEMLCDAFCADIANGKIAEGWLPRPRVSPGYGDLALALQQDIFRALTPSVKIGVSLTERLQMSPSKSVSALIGLQKR